MRVYRWESRRHTVAIDAAVRLLRDGNLVAFPTETVYGLGADAGNPVAVRRIFQLKGRPANHPLIVHIAGGEHLAQWADNVPDAAYCLAERFWPGPLTLILPRADRVPLEVTGGQNTIGLRVPDHPLALDLLRAFDGGLAAPSANRFGRISPTRASHVREELGAQVGMILDGGACRVGLESTIVSLVGESPCLLRPGGISGAEIVAALGRKLELSVPDESAVRAPGLLPSHYAPLTPLELHSPAELWLKVQASSEMGMRVAVISHSRNRAEVPSQAGVHRVLMPPAADAYAQELYAVMRTLDRGGYDCLFVETPPATQEWSAINNRLLRAAQNNTGDMSDDKNKQN